MKSLCLSLMLVILTTSCTQFPWYKRDNPEAKASISEEETQKSWVYERDRFIAFYDKKLSEIKDSLDLMEKMSAKREGDRQEQSKTKINRIHTFFQKAIGEFKKLRTVGRQQWSEQKERFILVKRELETIHQEEREKFYKI